MDDATPDPIMDDTRAKLKSKLVSTLSELVVMYLGKMVEEGREAGAITTENSAEVRAYIAALLIRGGLKALDELRPEGEVLVICEAIISTDSFKTVH